MGKQLVWYTIKIHPRLKSNRFFIIFSLYIDILLIYLAFFCLFFISFFTITFTPNPYPRSVLKFDWVDFERVPIYRYGKLCTKQKKSLLFIYYYSKGTFSSH